MRYLGPLKESYRSSFDGAYLRGLVSLALCPARSRALCFSQLLKLLDDDKQGIPVPRYIYLGSRVIYTCSVGHTQVMKC